MAADLPAKIRQQPTKLNAMSKVNKMPELLAKMSVDAYQAPETSEDEQQRKLWEDMVKRMDRSQLYAASVNYHVWLQNNISNPLKAVK